MKTKALQLQSKHGKLLFIASLFSFVVCGILYAYLINQTVLNVVARKNVEERIAILSSEVGELENEYLARKNEITRETATALGFVEEQNITYVYRNSSARALTLLDTE